MDTTEAMSFILTCCSGCEPDRIKTWQETTYTHSLWHWVKTELKAAPVGHYYTLLVKQTYSHLSHATSDLTVQHEFICKYIQQQSQRAQGLHTLNKPFIKLIKGLHGQIISLLRQKLRCISRGSSSGPLTLNFQAYSPNNSCWEGK